MKRFGTVLMALLVGLALLAPAAQAEKRIAIGATVASSPFYGYFIAVSQLVNKNVKGVSATVVETGATVDNLKRMKRDQLDLGLVTTNTLHYAYYGKGKFKNKPIKSKLLWVYYVAPQVAIARKDSGVTSLKDLTGKKFCPGMRGSSTEQTTIGIFKLLGIKPDVFKGSSADYKAAIKDNRIVGLVSSSMGNKFSATQIDISTFTPIKVLGLNQDQVARVKKAFPELAIANIPAGSGKGIPAFATWAFSLATSASENLDTETAYQIVKAVMEDKTKQVGAMGSLAGVDFAKATIENASSPLHPGTIKYLREKGCKIPEALIAPEDR